MLPWRNWHTRASQTRFSLGSIPSGNTKCDCGGIGRRSGFKFRWEIPVRVRASPVAPSIYGGSKAVMRHLLKMRADKFTDSNLNSKKICHDDNRWFDSSPPFHRDTNSNFCTNIGYLKSVPYPSKGRSQQLSKDLTDN